jgi:hypothetical protein
MGFPSFIYRQLFVHPPQIPSTISLKDKSFSSPAPTPALVSKQLVNVFDWTLLSSSLQYGHSPKAKQQKQTFSKPILLQKPK